MQREHLGSCLGFILLSAGCAIGIGNVWKFPWMTGQYGGGAFVLIYLLFLLVLGVPVLTMEFAMGRAAQKSPLKMYGQLKPGSRWGWHGYVCLLGNIVLMMFYTTVAGWMLQYFVDTAAGGTDDAPGLGIGHLHRGCRRTQGFVLLHTLQQRGDTRAKAALVVFCEKTDRQLQMQFLLHGIPPFPPAPLREPGVDKGMFKPNFLYYSTD